MLLKFENIKEDEWYVDDGDKSLQKLWLLGFVLLCIQEKYAIFAKPLGNICTRVAF